MSTEQEFRWVPVGEIGDVRMGKQLSPASSRDDGSHAPYLRVANVLDGWIDYSDVKFMSFNALERKRYGLEPGDILLNEGQSLELVGRSAIYDGRPGEYYFQNTLIRFRAGVHVIPEYAQAIFTQWLRDGTFAQVAKKTTSIAHLGGDRFAKIPFPLISISRQRRVIGVLGAVNEKRRSSEAKIGKLHSVRSALWDKFESAGDVSWPLRKLTELARLPSGQVDPTRLPYASQQLLAPDHVESSTGRIIARLSAAEQGAISGKYVVRPGDVILSKIRPALRKVVVSDFEGTCSADMYPLRSSPEVLPEYLCAALLGSKFSQFADRVSGRTGIPKLNREDLGEYSLRVPPIGDQKVIMSALESLAETEQFERLGREKITSLQYTLVGDLIAGKAR
ncbi:restriction endonuclease subunit S [Streptomyces albogriseolus]|uniref:Restriction endonuclease subunit S n=1 Tax=Streptomyces prasinosporus TaxID=68256 RepID=A0ABP6U613_9ACTN|nr:hypothetical protein GCM10010332_15360 [Streptomyces albogriseolus]